MIRFVWMVVWQIIACYAFYLLGRSDGGRERQGRMLVGLGALLVAAVLAMPEDRPGLTVGDALGMIGLSLASLFLVAGIIMAKPGGWRCSRKAQTEAAPDQDAPDGSPPPG